MPRIKETDEPKEPPPSTPDTTPSSRVSTSTPAAVVGPVPFDELPGLPRLRYRILEYKVKLSIIVSLLVLESSLLPIALYYGLVLGTTLRHGIVFAIITSFFGLVTGIEFGLRCLKLIWKGDTYRPAGGTKWSFDFTHWTLSFGYTVMTGILIGASIPHDPLVRPLAIPVSLFLLQVGLQLVWSGWMNTTGRPAPCKISSIPKGGRVPPLVFTLVEDVVGVDGAGGREYRNSLLARYETSPRFRKMIAQQNWFWAVGALADGIGTMVVIWTVPEKVAYGVGWGSPFVFVLIWATISVHWTLPTFSPTMMARDLESLPPELILQIAECENLDLSSLSFLIRTNKCLHFLLWWALYRRELSKRNPAGLIRCIRAGSITAVSKFIAAGVDLNAKIDMSPDLEDFTGFTFPLATAVVRGQKEIVDLLLDNGARVDTKIDGFLCYTVLDHTWARAIPNTPLSVAVVMGHVDIAILLVRRMVNPDSVVCTLSGSEYTALEQAALCLCLEVVVQLLVRGANPNKQRRGENSAILHALLEDKSLRDWVDGMRHGQQIFMDTILMLLQYGADPFIKRRCGSHSGDSGSEDCRCSLSASSMGIRSPYERVRLHFKDLAHRQRCENPACRDIRHKYGIGRDGIPEQCELYPDTPTSKETLQSGG
ncbi:ankyrin repeat-containing domain protein [Chaetomidium leptoderma]|uniref:Ankyrin repeat-containing domain protein n=1 Tax=Chaetomidium leptoderma TaxID=669021 RepID=A0AAN6VLT7_9PEZI|nr:ankyrin repeat-containing domain protein [Chaetomidium leptoderma]